MQSKATTVEAYLAELPADRRTALQTVRKVIQDNLDGPFGEGMQYGMMGWYVPHSIYPKGYHCDPRQPLPYAGLASQKQHMSLYVMGLYTGFGLPEFSADNRWFHQAWARTGKKLDMGKSCIRFKKLEDLALDVIAEAIRRLPLAEYVRRYESVLAGRGARKPATVKKTAAKKPGVKKSASKKTAKKKATAKKAGARKATSGKSPRSKSARR